MRPGRKNWSIWKSRTAGQNLALSACAAKFSESKAIIKKAIESMRQAVERGERDPVMIATLRTCFRSVIGRTEARTKCWNK